MEILSPEDRVVLWRSAVDAQGAQRRAFIHAIAREVFESLSDLSLYDSEYATMTLTSLELLDTAGLFSRDGLRRTIESLHEDDRGVDALAAEVAGLLREASGVEHLDVDRRVQAIELATAWREHVLAREQSEPELLSVGDVAAKFGITTQAVYKWLHKGRIEGERTPGGSWRIPAAQFDRDKRPHVDRAQLDELQAKLTRLHADRQGLSESELAGGLRDDD